MVVTRSAARVLVDSLVLHGVDRVFCVPGESYLAVLDALVDAPSIATITCRHESGAGFMAVADAKATGRPGVAIVSRGPGASNAAIAVHTAQQDAAPLVLLIGQVARRDRGRGAFQEVDYRQTFGDMAKWVSEVHDAELLSEQIARAFQIAASGTPGPVIMVLPEDLLDDPVSAPLVPAQGIARPQPTEADVAAVAGALATARRPLLVVGSMLAGEDVRPIVRSLAEAWALPVCPTFKQQDILSFDHPNYGAYLGYLIPKAQRALLAEADLVLAIGTRLGDVSTQEFTIPTAPVPAQPLIHVHPDPNVIGRVFRTAQGVVADPVGFARALAARNPPPPPPERAAWQARLNALHRELGTRRTSPAVDGVVLGAVIEELGRQAAADAVLITDAGNHSGWVHRYYPIRSTNRMLGAVAGAMGFGVPAAVAAALRWPGRQVLAVVGDGGFLMTGAELATAMAHRLKVRLIVSNNRSYATIRLHQERKFPGRPMATDLVNPDFAALARAYGATGLHIEREADIEGAVRAALAAPGPAVIDVRASQDHIAPGITLTGLAAAR
ncbi:MAG: acetolactate synthase [Alphaproteobacteria bacterium]|nr:acetolactate synthase [Alphaproteobacteria bacterium]